MDIRSIAKDTKTLSEDKTFLESNRRTCNITPD